MVLRALAAVLSALVIAPAASAAPPSNLRGFVLGASEVQSSPHSFTRTPAFAWGTVPGADRYEFEVATSRTFGENALVWKKTDIRTPLTNVPLTLPWIGKRTTAYAWYARVRAVVNGVKTGWSDRYGFNLAAASIPLSLSSGANPNPGMVRWTPVSGATAYEVVFVYDLAGAKTKTIRTATAAVDLREYYTFHNDTSTWSSSTVSWRARAVRELDGRPLNDIPVVSYGKWSDMAETTEPPLGTGQIALEGSISRSGATDVAGTSGAGAMHSLVPGFWWSGSLSVGEGFGACSADVAALGVTCPLFHVYVYTDDECVNRVHNSDLVGSPAYVPRLSGVLDLPAEQGDLDAAADLYLTDGDEEGSVYDAANEPVYAAGTGPNAGGAAAGEGDGKVDRRTGLWDIDWTDTGYFWTVVPAVPRLLADGSVEYQDVAFGEDHCAAGQRLAFSKTSEPVTEKGSGVPYASGQTSAGVRSATSAMPAFFGPRIVVAWRPAPGARKYQVQWSRKAYPFEVVGSKTVRGTQALLTLSEGTWHYRVRGIDTTIPGTRQGMTWSDPQYVRILPRTFYVG